ncbi:MAG: hypothetical protein CME43_02090 [Haliea sp.]|uniref:putative ATP-dependent zinc protease n=1 Tax=Haliea sp. TaxID=1932666 RepID=UPI000C38CF5E|nr:RimK/LysX family protein [Haliea sp.]MBM68252.1 hypothetical protein [Haliea sp.]|tara:strand:+ start:23637 stop:24293 length:657 start_codon:yes stop_codon:yes gene_type:complete
MVLRFKVTALVMCGLLAGCQALPEQANQAPICPEAPVVMCPICPLQECPEPRVLEKIVLRPAAPVPVPARPSTAGELELPIIGVLEFVRVEPSGLTLEAVIDTASEHTIIAARDVQLLEKDGKRYVSYVLVDPASDEQHALEAPLLRRTSAVDAYGNSSRNYIVSMWLTLGDSRARVEVNLSENTEMPYPVVVGRNLLTDVAIVDVSRRHTLEHPAAP